MTTPEKILNKSQYLIYIILFNILFLISNLGIFKNIEIALQLRYSGEVSPETPQLSVLSIQYLVYSVNSNKKIKKIPYTKKCYLAYQQDIQGGKFPS